MDTRPNRLVFERTALQALQDINKIKRELAGGKQVRELLHLDADTLAHLYGCAYRLFQQQRYEAALHAFLFLIFLDRQQYDLWLGLGMTLQMCHRYEAAIDAYELAATCEIENPVAYFYLAKCLFAIHDHETALEALEMAIGYAEDNEDYRDLLQQAHAARESLLRRQ